MWQLHDSTCHDISHLSLSSLRPVNPIATSHVLFAATFAVVVCGVLKGTSHGVTKEQGDAS